MLRTCPLSSGCFLVERHQLPVPDPRRELLRSPGTWGALLGLHSVLPAGAGHRHSTRFILILALLHRLGQTRIIPSPQNVQESADFLELSGQDRRLPCWVMGICEGVLHISP